MKAVGILGGGVSGLSAAYYLKKSSQSSIKLFEASQRVGGWIKSSRSGKGHIFENGPRTLRPRGEAGENTIEMVYELGIADKIIFIPRNHPAALNRLIYANNTLHKLPSDLLSLLITKPPFSRPLISALINDLKASRKEIGDESIYDFTKRRFGKEIAEFAISPLICGICAGNAKEISVKFLMKNLFEAEQKHGSVFKGLLKEGLKKKKNNDVKSKNVLAEKCKQEKWSVYSFEGGMETLPLALAKEVKKQGTEIQFNAKCKEITFRSNKVFLSFSDNDYEFDHVVSSLPAHHLASLLKEQHPQLSKELGEIPFVNVGVVNLQFPGNVLNREAFGFLVPPSQNLPILGIVFDSCCFPDQGDTVVTVMMGGHWFEKFFGKSPSSEDLLEVAVKQASSILGTPSKPESQNVSILQQCIPQYVIGHHDRIERIRSYIQTRDLPLTLCGSSYDGVGVNDAILSARKAALC
ncbi:Protoporphyrinogen oxidase [Gryllus bimaculatus]|nr:Protoporphyrinogen oxidase [Gryllus bimaculatus]